MNQAQRWPLSTWGFTLLRMVVGWHLLYEGLVKLLARHWTAADYLMDSTWLLAGLFRRMAESQGVLRVIDLANMAGLALIGLALMLGLFTRLASALGALLILLYYISNPPFVGLRGMAGEGNYLLVNRNLIEIVALLTFILIPRGGMYGLDHLLAMLGQRGRREVPAQGGLSPRQENLSEEPPVAPRRQLLKDLVGLPVLGAFGCAIGQKRRWGSLEEKRLLEAGIDGLSSATLKKFVFSKLADLQGTMTYGHIGTLKVSRLILGGNLIGGWAHARDLLYASDLVKAYHNDERVVHTFRLAEKCGVNTILTHPKLLRIIRKYWDEYGGRIQYIADCGGTDLPGMVTLAIKGGAHACYVQGATADRLVQESKTDDIRRALDLIRSHGLPAGIGGHRIGTVKACCDKGIQPDFWMKTMHHHHYWSARPNEPYQDNNFCLEPQETIDVMATRAEPWIAFKVLAAGAIPPKDGFAYAFQNGADFICVGMYDFQIVDDVNMAAQILGGITDRARSWRA